MTPRDVVRLYRPDMTDEQVDYVLWEETCFPMGSLSQWWKQVDDLLGVPA